MTSYEARKGIESRRDLSYGQISRRAMVVENHIHLVQRIYKEYHDQRLIDFYVHHVYGILGDLDAHYRRIEVRKRNGKIRILYEPSPELKRIQRFLATRFFAPLFRASEDYYANGFVEKRGIKVNAFRHVHHPYLLKLDIKEFFPSITRDLVLAKGFGNVEYPASVRMLIASLITYQGSLPQGAPTSPIVSNIVLTGFDQAMGQFAKERRLTYSRYADDLCLSSATPFAVKDVIAFVKAILREYGMRLNKEKTAYITPGHRHLVCGVLTDEKVNAPLAYRRCIRQEMRFCMKHGIDGHLGYLKAHRKIPEGTTIYDYAKRLYGQVNFVLHLDPGNAEFQTYGAFLAPHAGKKEKKTASAERERHIYEKLHFYFALRDQLVFSPTDPVEDRLIDAFVTGASLRPFIRQIRGSDIAYWKILMDLRRDMEHMWDALVSYTEELLDHPNRSSKLYVYLMTMLSQTFDDPSAEKYWVDVALSMGIARANILRERQLTDHAEKRLWRKKAADAKCSDCQFDFGYRYRINGIDKTTAYAYILASAENGYRNAFIHAIDIYHEYGVYEFVDSTFSNLLGDLDDYFTFRRNVEKMPNRTLKIFWDYYLEGKCGQDLPRDVIAFLQDEVASRFSPEGTE